MPHPFTTLGPITAYTYTLLLALGILLAIVLTSIRYRLRHALPVGAVVDVCIAGLIGGVLLARIVHVALNWTYFNLHRDEIRFVSAGGLDWHGAVIGALTAMFFMVRLRRVRLPALLDILALALPIIGFMAWWGCGANHCAYGAEVDNLSHYPAWLVWERNDIYNIILPRYATQPLGMMFSAAVFVLAVGVGWLQSGRRVGTQYAVSDPLTPNPSPSDYAASLTGEGLISPQSKSVLRVKYLPSPEFGGRAGDGGKLPHRILTDSRFWLVLAIYALGMFAIGFLRGDFAVMIGGLRLDQWLDLGMVVFAVMGDLLLRRSRRRRSTSAPDYTAATPHRQSR